MAHPSLPTDDRRPVRAIETNYAGCRFRSRLEARWAVFFDHLDIPWEYESEGYETPAGRYLPDFYALGAWIEIKGGSFTRRDRDRAVAFAGAKWRERGDKFRVLQGDIPRPGTRTVLPFPDSMGGPREIPGVLALSLIHPLDVSDDRADPNGHIDWKCMPGPTEWVRMPWAVTDWTFDAVDSALTAARSARFEHGQTPVPAQRSGR